MGARLSCCAALLCTAAAHFVLHCPNYEPCTRNAVIHIPRTGGESAGAYVLQCTNRSGLYQTHKHQSQIRPVLQTTAERVLLTLRDPAEHAISVFQFAVEGYGNPRQRSVVLGQRMTKPEKAPKDREWTIDNASQLVRACHDDGNERLRKHRIVDQIDRCRPEWRVGSAYSLGYAWYWANVSLGEPRVRALCMEEGLAQPFEDLFRTSCPGSYPPPRPMLHIGQSTKAEYRMTCELRRELYRRMPEDLRIYRHFCRRRHDEALRASGCELERGWRRDEN